MAVCHSITYLTLPYLTLLSCLQFFIIKHVVPQQTSLNIKYGFRSIISWFSQGSFSHKG